MILITVDLRDVVLFTTTLLAIVNPISSAVLFATMSGRFGGVIQRRMANQSAFAVLVILLVCVWIGRPLLQILGIVALEPPSRVDAEGLHLERTKLFDAIRPLERSRVVFGQYDGYRDEDGVAEDSQVETFAANGVRAMPSISTFVIGVFGPEDAASQTNLDTIARSGGTTKAFIVDTSGDVAKEFQDALRAIRGSALVSCDFQVPPSTSGAMLDFGKVNLEVTHGNGKKEQLVYVDSDAACAGSASAASILPSRRM